MAPSRGKNYRIFISSDGTDTGTKTELECQGDLTINLGKSTSRQTTKNCGAHSFVEDDGFSATGTFLEETPLGTAQALVWAAHDAEASTHCWIESTVTGGQSFAGSMLVVISSIGAPERGAVEYSIELSADGDVTRATVA